MTEKRIALFSCLFLWKIQFKEKKLLKEREVSIITNGGFEVKQMSAAEREAFMSALLERVLELRRKRKEVNSHAT
jgi:acetolactate synthase regulatory subunit